MSTIFPKWTNRLPTMMLGGVLGTLAVAIGGAWYYFTPKFWRAGYMPIQPGTGFSHQIHAGKLGLDCRYCHSHVEESAEANVPSVSTCMGCHAPGHVNDGLYAKAANVQHVRDAWTAGVRFDEIQRLQGQGKHDEADARMDAYVKDGLPVVEGGASIAWRRVHKLPDYVRNFPHHVHLNAGVSCFSCHGNIMEQPVVHQVQPLSMSWCLDCHANPTPHLVPKDKVTDLYWVRDQLAAGNAPSRPKPIDPSEAGSPTNPLDPGSPGGAALLDALRKKDLHLLPQNCGACHY